MKGVDGVGTGVLQPGPSPPRAKLIVTHYFSITPFKYGRSIITRPPDSGKKNEHTIRRPEIA